MSEHEIHVEETFLEGVEAVSVFELARREPFELLIVLGICLLHPDIVIFQSIHSIFFKEFLESLSPRFKNFPLITDGIVKLLNLILVPLRPRNQLIFLLKLFLVLFKFLDNFITEPFRIYVSLVFFLDVEG